MAMMKNLEITLNYEARSFLADREEQKYAGATILEQTNKPTQNRHASMAVC